MTMFKEQKKKIIFNLIFIIFLGYFKNSNAQNLDYEIFYFNNSSYFYNSVVLNNKLYVSSKDGVFELHKKKLEVYDTSLIGPIKVENDKLKEGVTIISNNYDYLLPDFLKKDPYSVTYFENKLILISGGKVFGFKKTLYQKKNVGSVRSISENFIGTYNGVFKKGDPHKILKYTNSYIREFNEATFICWDGLYYKNDTLSKNFTNEINSSTEIGDKLLGRANDIVEVKHPNYILNTNKGFYLINIEKEECIKISDQYNDVNFASYTIPFKNTIQFSEVFSHNNAIYTLNKITHEIKELFHFKSPVVSVLFYGPQEIYVLLKTRLVKVNPVKNSSITILDNLKLVNDVSAFYNFIFITTDVGLHLYNISTGNYAKNVLKTELNKKAYFGDKNNLFIGGVSGLYTFSLPDLNELYQKNLKKSEPRYLKIFNSIYQLKTPFIVLLILILLITSIVFYKKNQSSVSLLSSKEILEDDIKYKIEKFIDLNLNEVSIEKIKNEFKLSNYTLYNIMDRKNPGEIIRRKRLFLVKNLRKQGVPEKEISKKTGFSLNYLRNI